MTSITNLNNPALTSTYNATNQKTSDPVATTTTTTTASETDSVTISAEALKLLGGAQTMSSGDDSPVRPKGN